jgi:hypothetical protein
LIIKFPKSGPDKYIALGRKPQVPAVVIYSHPDEVFNLGGDIFNRKGIVHFTRVEL